MQIAAQQAAITAATASAGETARAPERKLTVYLSDSAGVNNVVKAQAQGVASQMFARLGVKIDWNPGRPGAG